MRSTAARTALVLLLAGMLGAAAAGNQARVAMRAIFDALGELLPLSLVETRFESDSNRAAVEGGLKRMLDNADSLGGHGGSLPASYEFLRQTLVNDVRQAAQSYRLGHYEAARFLVHDLVNTCFGCHTRLPETQRFDMGAALLGKPAVASLPLTERALLATAARQFDQALALYETLFVAPEELPSDIAYSGAFESYLKIALRVRGDFDRARAAIARFEARDDLPEYLRNHARSWLAALDELRVAERPGDNLEAGREVFREALLTRMFREDPRALVHFVEASRLLHRYVQARTADNVRGTAARERLGEAYYLLGVAESHITSNYWYSETEFFLESSIRLAPGSGFARKAYAWLEEEALLGYTGSAGLEVPALVADYLAGLRRLMDNAAPSLD